MATKNGWRSLRFCVTFKLRYHWIFEQCRKFDKEIEDVKKGKKDYVPMTMEGCVVRFADTIAYLGRDIQDAIEIGIINSDLEVPERCRENIGTKNDGIINALVIDLVENSYGQNYISYSKEISESVQEYKELNYKCIYHNENLLSEKEKIETMYKILYKKFLDDLGCEDKTSKIYQHFIDVGWISKEYFENSSHAEQVRDYIAGMTDRYFESVFKEIMLPRRVTTFVSNEGL